MKRAWFIAAVACSSKGGEPQPAPAPPPAPGPQLSRDAAAATPADAANAAEASDAKLLRPLTLAGPYTSLAEACAHATPCGGTELDEKTGNSIHPPAQPECAQVLDPSKDSDAADANAKAQVLVHAVGGDELRLGAVQCASPPEIHATEGQYYVFAHHADGWWRTAAPVFALQYNDKYCGGQMVVRWNDQPGRTFVGIAVTRACVGCDKQGSENEGLELMIRAELAGARPSVFPPLVVGERHVVQRDASADAEVTCKPTNEHVSLDEHWPSADELVLTGSATWHEVPMRDGMIDVGLGAAGKPSTAGRYRFMR